MNHRARRLCIVSFLSCAIPALLAGGCESQAPRDAAAEDASKASAAAKPAKAKDDKAAAKKSETDRSAAGEDEAGDPPPSGTIPAPAEQAVDVVVSGRTSTLRSVDIQRVGKNIPYTYSHGKIANTPGFEWWVSKHFALKSDLPREKIQLYLELLELSYPHYVEAFGAEPPNIENQRIAAVYGSSRARVRETMLDDGFLRGVHETAGGETMYYNLAGYSFPSAREHHQRYIVIHETAHAFQMALSDYSGWLPTWWGEGIADSLAHHVWDPINRQLTLMVFERGVMDYLQIGLDEYAKGRGPSLESIIEKDALKRGINFLIVHYMLDDPLRAQKFRIYRDEMLQRRVAGLPRNADATLEVLRSVFPDWETLEREFATWVGWLEKDFGKTFHLDGGPWEQEGNAFWVRTRSSVKGMPRLRLDLAPGQSARYDAQHVDFPRTEVPSFVGPVRRGGDTPSIGYDVAFLPDHLHRGVVGMALGIEEQPANARLRAANRGLRTREIKKHPDLDLDEQLRVLLEYGDTLVIEGEPIGVARHAFALPRELVAALESSAKPRVGVNIKIDANAVQVTVRSDAARSPAFVRSVTIDANLREKLLSRPVAVVASAVSHRITPHVDDGRRLNPRPVDLNVAAPPNRWRSALDDSLYRLVRAQWRAGVGTVGPLDEAVAEFAAAAAAPAGEREKLDQAHPQALEKLAAAVANAPKGAEALVELSGADLRFEWQRPDARGRQGVALVLRNHGELPLKGTIQISRTDGQAVDAPAVDLAPGAVLRTRLEPAADGAPPPAPATDPAADPAAETEAPGANGSTKVAADEPVALPAPLFSATAKLTWAGHKLELTRSAGAEPYPGVVLEAPSVKSGEANERTVTAAVRGPFGGKTDGTVRFEALPGTDLEAATVEVPVSVRPFERREVQAAFKPKSGVSWPKGAMVQVVADLVADGEPVRLRSRVKID
ncbi:MAG: hypothetical protein B7733_07180 [Myxococcales bacterium FL481]|nr:MAG: hypothetical protein B7733_07180 [Myxococcales bacterium FL481]